MVDIAVKLSTKNTAMVCIGRPIDFSVPYAR